jgi:hypothetical protein|nr:MAG TPA: 8-oxoguanine DNA glycosylase [Caudoviricetes sp.]
MYVLTIPNFDLSQIYESCQDISVKRIFGYERTAYLFFRGEDMLKVEQVGDRVLFSCTDDQFYDKWFDFFDLSTDYSVLNAMVNDVKSSKSIMDAARQSSGMHILSQDPWECILKETVFDGCKPSVAISRLESIKEASMKENGKTLKGFGYIKWRPLPNPDQLESSMELLDWFCDTEVVSMCISLVEWSKCHRELLVASGSHSKDEVRTELSKLGFSKHKVDRIMAYGFGFHDEPCFSEKQEKQIKLETGVDIETLMEFEMPDLSSKAAYVGTIMARQQAMKNGRS